MFSKTIIAMLCLVSLSTYSMQDTNDVQAVEQPTRDVQEVDSQWLLAQLSKYKETRTGKKRRDDEVARLKQSTQAIPKAKITRMGRVHGNEIQAKL